MLVFAAADLTGTGKPEPDPVRTIKGRQCRTRPTCRVADGNGDPYVAQQIGPVEVSLQQT